MDSSSSDLVSALDRRLTDTSGDTHETSFLLMRLSVIIQRSLQLCSGPAEFYWRRRRSGPLAIGSKGLCRQKPFFVCQKVQSSSKMLPKIPNFASFCHPKMRPFQQCITVTAVNLFYEILPKQFEAFDFYFSDEKTDDCWILGIVHSCSFCYESHCDLADH